MSTELFLEKRAAALHRQRLAGALFMRPETVAEREARFRYERRQDAAKAGAAMRSSLSEKLDATEARLAKLEEQRPVVDMVALERKIMSKIDVRGVVKLEARELIRLIGGAH